MRPGTFWHYVLGFAGLLLIAGACTSEPPVLSGDRVTIRLNTFRPIPTSDDKATILGTFNPDICSAQPELTTETIGEDLVVTVTVILVTNNEVPCSSGQLSFRDVEITQFLEATRFLDGHCFPQGIDNETACASKNGRDPGVLRDLSGNASGN